MPPKGWLNDPNGLCFYQGWYHVFFQYSPEAVLGGLKIWGHYRSKDLLRWEFVGTPVLADTPYDKHGAYSGTALTEDGMLELFYTGNVKLDGEYDYILNGRIANVLTLESTDGISFGEKQCLLTNADYPGECTGHVRDPKVWKDGQSYYMLLGARSKQEEGFFLLYSSKDKRQWTFQNSIRADEPFGYMWECPDTFCIDGRRILMCCPQGLSPMEHRFQNIYQAGYFVCESEALAAEISPRDFTEWDMGFDFYAPQTFAGSRGERFLIGWAGLPDAPYGNAGAVAEGWQHSMTCLRALSLENGRLRQQPAACLKELRGEELAFSSGSCISGHCFDMELAFADENEECGFQIGEDVAFVCAEGLVRLTFFNQTGDGRTKRTAKLSKLKDVRVLFDHSLLEIFVNQGELVFTTRYYPAPKERLRIRVLGHYRETHLWKMENRR